MLNYLRRIKQIWFFIAGADTQLLNQFDASSITFLECEGPSLSQPVRISISKGMKNATLFPGIKTLQTRAELENRICSISYRIPTIRTLIMDLKFLNPLSKRMLELGTLLEVHDDDVSAEFCTIRDTFVEREVEFRGEQCRDLVERQYIDLWLLLIRNYAVLSGEQLRSGHKKTMKIDSLPKICKYRLAELVDAARSMGYLIKNDEIPSLTALLVEDIRETLERARKCTDLSNIIEFINGISESSYSQPEHHNLSFVGDTTIKKFLRMGPPTKKACDIAGEMLYHCNLVLGNVNQNGYDINEFCILHFFVINFFYPQAPFSTLLPDTPPEDPPQYSPNNGIPAASTENNTPWSPEKSNYNQASSSNENNAANKDNNGNSSRVEFMTGNDNDLATNGFNVTYDDLSGDIILILKLFEDDGGYFQTGWSLLFTVFREKRPLFFNDISDVYNNNQGSIRFVTQDFKAVPIEELSQTTRNSCTSDGIIFGVTRLSSNFDNRQSVTAHESLVETLIWKENETSASSSDLSWLEDWFRANEDLGVRRTARWFRKNKRKHTFDEEVSSPRRARHC